MKVWYGWLLSYFSKYEWLLVIDGIEPVSLDDFGFILLADGVGRQSVHVNLDVRPHFLVRQELARDHLWFEILLEIGAFTNYLDEIAFLNLLVRCIVQQ